LEPQLSGGWYTGDVAWVCLSGDKRAGSYIPRLFELPVIKDGGELCIRNVYMKALRPLPLPIRTDPRLGAPQSSVMPLLLQWVVAPVKELTLNQEGQIWARIEPPGTEDQSLWVIHRNATDGQVNCVPRCLGRKREMGVFPIPCMMPQPSLIVSCVTLGRRGVL